MENLHYNTQSHSWIESSVYKAEQKSLFGGKYGKVDNWIDSDWQEVAPESKINKGDYILWMTPTNR